nr:GNAT family N-acetyltransferase [Shewanella baltica]
MLFVDSERQKKGIGRALLLFTLEYVKVDVVTVSASLSSVPAYVKYGFKFNGDTRISAGLVYQPMKIELILSHYNQL